MAAVELFVNDEQPAWSAVIQKRDPVTRQWVAYADFSSGWTFTCLVVSLAGATLLTKNTGITGASDGSITTNFTGAELATGTVTATFADDHRPYKLFLTARRTADSSDLSISEDLVMSWRP